MKRVLIVEDETIMRESLRDWLKEEGYEVDTAESGEEALHKIGKIVHFFLYNTPQQYDELKALFLNPLIPKIINEIFKDIKISGIQLANNLNEPIHKIHYYLKKIKDLELIKKKRDKSGRKFYWINKNLLSCYNEVFKEPHF